MYYTVIKHSSHLRILGKCRKHSPAARAFYISLEFSNACRVLSECKTRLGLLYLLNITLRTDLLTFGVTGAVFNIAGEMCRLPAYFDNPDCCHILVLNVNFDPLILDLLFLQSSWTVW